MSDIRFNQWLHNSGTGGVSQVDGGHVGIGTTNPLIPVGAGVTAVLNVGVVTANYYYGDGSNLSGVQVGGASSLSFNDNIGAYFGNSQDLKIHHDGNHSYIDDQGTGNLRLRSGTLEILNLAGNKTSAIFSSGGGQTLNFNNSTKFVTTNTGVVVTGIMTASSGSFIKNSNNYVVIGSSNAGGASLVLDGDSNGDGAGGDYSYIQHDPSGNFNIIANNPAVNANIVFYTGATEKVRITSAGNVGIGTDDPSGLTHWVAPSDMNLYLKSKNATGTIRWNYEDSGGTVRANHAFVNYGNGKSDFFTWATHDGSSLAERVRIASDGEVFIGEGFGDTNRSTLLSISGANQDPTGVWSQIGVYSSDSQAANKGGSIGFGGQDGSNAKQQFSAIKGAKENGTSGDYAGYMAFYTRPAGAVSQERLRITSSGHVLPGADSAYYLGSSSVRWAEVNTDKLSVGLPNANGSVANFKGGTYNQINIAHSSNSSWGLLLTNSGPGSGSGYHQSTSGNDNTCAIVNVNNDALYLATNNTARWRVEHDGHFIPFSGGSFDIGSTGRRVRRLYASNSTNTSDRNEKNTITESDLGLDFICKLKPVSYKWNQKEGEDLDTKTHYGLIAQDVEEVIIETGKTLDDFGAIDKPDGDPMGLSYNEFVSPLVKAIQDLKSEINTLQQENQTLRIRVTNLEDK